MELVITHLRTNLPENLSSIQINKRLHLLDALAIYANEKTFPTNNNHSIRMPYFVDSKGIHCAVGQLMHVSGNDTLVADIRKDYNYSYIADIKTKGVTEWCKEYGFTINELKWIQPGYLPPSILKEAGEGQMGQLKNYIKMKFLID